MPAAYITKVVEAPEDNACAVCALAMYLGRSYYDVLRVVATLDKRHQGRAGLFTNQIKRVAAALGTKLRERKQFDLSDTFGLLLLPDHVVLIRNGLAVEPDGTLWDVEDYLKAKKRQPESVLVAEDEGEA